MNGWVNATGSPKGFVQAVKSGQRVYADFDGDFSLQWNPHDGANFVYLYAKVKKGEHNRWVSGLFKRTDEDCKDILAFFTIILKITRLEK